MDVRPPSGMIVPGKPASCIPFLARYVLAAILFLTAAVAAGSAAGYAGGLLVSGFRWWFGTVILTAVSIAMIAFSVRSSEKYLRDLRAVAEQQAEMFPDLRSIIADLSGKAGIPEPSVAVIPSDDPNIFACGRSGDAVIVLTDALSGMLTGDELEAVIAREISNIRRGDCRSAMLAAAVGYGCVLFSGYLSLGLIVFGISDMAEIMKVHRTKPAYRNFVRICRTVLGVFLALAGVVLLAVYPVSLVPRLGMSRRRVADADRAAAYLTGRPRVLADALRKLQDADVGEGKVDGARADIMAVDHSEPGTKMGRALCRHPPTEKRVRMLLAIDNSSPAGDIYSVR